jgi:hypothetical protein
MLLDIEAIRRSPTISYTEFVNKSRLEYVPNREFFIPIYHVKFANGSTRAIKVYGTSPGIQHAKLYDVFNMREVTWQQLGREQESMVRNNLINGRGPYL